MSHARKAAEWKLTQSLAENDILKAEKEAKEALMEEVRKLADQKKKLKAKGIGFGEEKALHEKNAAIRRKVEWVIPRPVRMPPGATIKSPRADSPTKLSPRIEEAERVLQGALTQAKKVISQNATPEIRF